MKRIIIFILMLGLLSWGVWAALQPKTASPEPVVVTPEPTEKVYVDPGQRFTIRYPATWSAAGPEAGASTPNGWSIIDLHPGTVAAKLSVPKSLYPGTNFSEAWLTVG